MANESNEVELHGIERMCTMGENSSYKLAMIVSIDGPIRELIPKLKTAFTSTINRHPRMRGMLVKNKLHTAYIRDYLTEDEVEKLFVISEIGESWETIVQRECEIPFNRYEEIPYTLWVVVKNDRNAHLILFADHFMSDGVSGAFILHDVLSAATNQPETEEHQLTTDIYKIRRTPMIRFIEKTIMKAVRPIVTNGLRKFKPIFPIAADQKPFTIPLPVNPSRGLFHSGSPENMMAAIRRCKQEGVTVSTAMLVGVLLAVAKTKYKRLSDCPVVKVSMECAFDLRRGSEKTLELKVGAFSAATLVPGYKNKGMNLDANFWQESRRAKTELGKSYFLLNFTLAFFDTYMSAGKKKYVFDKQPGCIMGDFNYSNVGKYPFPLSYKFNSETIDLGTLNAHCSATHASSGCNLYFLSSNAFNYSMTTKYEEGISREFFDNMIKVIESMGTIQKDETIREAGRRIFNENGLDDTLKDMANKR